MFISASLLLLSQNQRRTRRPFLHCRYFTSGICTFWVSKCMQASARHVLHCALRCAAHHAGGRHALRDCWFCAVSFSPAVTGAPGLPFSAGACAALRTRTATCLLLPAPPSTLPPPLPDGSAPGALRGLPVRVVPPPAPQLFSTFANVPIGTIYFCLRCSLKRFLHRDFKPFSCCLFLFSHTTIHRSNNGVWWPRCIFSLEFGSFGVRRSDFRVHATHYSFLVPLLTCLFKRAYGLYLRCLPLVGPHDFLASALVWFTFCSLSCVLLSCRAGRAVLVLRLPIRPRHNLAMHCGSAARRFVHPRALFVRTTAAVSVRCYITGSLSSTCL